MVAPLQSSIMKGKALQLTCYISFVKTTSAPFVMSSVSTLKTLTAISHFVANSLCGYGLTHNIICRDCKLVRQ